MKGRQLLSAFVLAAGIALAVGCNDKYHGRVFTVKVTNWEGEEAVVEVWKNTSRLSYDKNENMWSFYVEGKFVVIDGLAVVIVEEGAPAPERRSSPPSTESAE